MIARRLGLFSAGVHFTCFAAMVAFTRYSQDGQASLLWLLFVPVDFPLSLGYCFAKEYSLWLHRLEPSLLAQLLYLPYLLHGLMGTIWWYFVPRLLTVKRLGGIWGARP